MKAKSVSVKDLGREADTDLDEVLVALWDVGLVSVDDENSVISARDVRRARMALGLDDNRVQLSVEYWLERSRLSREELSRQLEKADVHLSPNARRIPKNSLRRLQSMFGDVPVRSADTPLKGEPISLEPLEWRTIANSPIRRYLDESEIKAIHEP